jgi:hypothetical protein
MAYRRPLECPGFDSRGFKMANIWEIDLFFQQFDRLRIVLHILGLYETCFYKYLKACHFPFWKTSVTIVCFIPRIGDNDQFVMVLMKLFFNLCKRTLAKSVK